MSEFNVTERNVEDFKQDPVWMEMVKTLALRRKGYQEDLVNAGSMEEVSRIQGSINEIDYQMQQPDFILQEIEERKEEKETESDNESDETSV